MKYHYDGYNQIDNYKYGKRRYRNWNLHTLLVGMLNGPSCFGKLAVSVKVRANVATVKAILLLDRQPRK